MREKAHGPIVLMNQSIKKHRGAEAAETGESKRNGGD